MVLHAVVGGWSIELLAKGYKNITHVLVFAVWARLGKCLEEGYWKVCSIRVWKFPELKMIWDWENIVFPHPTKHQAHLPCSYSSLSIWLWVLNVYYYHLSSCCFSSPPPPQVMGIGLIKATCPSCLCSGEDILTYCYSDKIKHFGHAFLIISCRSLQVRDRQSRGTRQAL